MALVVFDGFDHYDSGVDMEQRFGALQYVGSSSSIAVQSTGRAGYGKCVALNGTFKWGLSLAVAQLTTGFAVNFQGVGSVLIIVLLDNLSGGATQCSWQLNSSTGTISFFDATGTNIATSLNSIGANGWYFIELQNAISKTAGTAGIRVNDQSVPSFPLQTGLNTQTTLNASVSGASMASPSGNNLLLDDLYIADGTNGPGTYVNNSFLGDVRTFTGFPVGNNSVTWVPLANTNWQEVSETAMDSDTSYNRTATAGAQDSFNGTSIEVDVNQVLGVQVTVALRKEDAGARTVAPVLVISGTTYVGTAVSVDVSYLYITTLWPINPHTSASWAASDLSGVSFGYVVVT
jgi:hypothetical protein